VTREAIRAFCLSLPHVTERFQFHHAAFQIGGKSFAMLNLEVEGFPLAFKCTAEDFGELVEIPGVIQAPYLARGQWVALTEFDTLPVNELKGWLTKAREVMLSKLTLKMQAELGQVRNSKPNRS
jgi:predicted DNA-binding protein (MmcQ/YjbR family)